VAFAARQDADRRRFKKALLLHIPPGPLEQQVARYCRAHHVRHLRPGDEREARRSRQAENIFEPLADHLFDDRFGRAPGMNYAFWSHADISQSAAIAAGKVPPMTQPKKRPQVLLTDPALDIADELVDDLRRSHPLRGERPAEARTKLNESGRGPHRPILRLSEVAERMAQRLLEGRSVIGFGGSWRSI